MKNKTQYIKPSKREKPTSFEVSELVAVFNRGGWVESSRLAIEMTQRFPKEGLGWKVLGVTLQQKGLIEEAFVALKKAADLLPNDAEAHYNLGNFYYDKNQLTEAEISYRRAIQADSSLAQAHYNLGSVLKDRGLFDQAEDCYLKALKINPNNFAMHLNLAQMYYEHKHFHDASNCYEAAINLDPTNAMPYMALGVVYKEIGQLVKAESCYRQALALNAGYVEAYSNLGVLLKETGRNQEAEGMYRKALNIQPDFVPAHNNLGMLFKSNGNLAKAEECYRKALSIDPVNAVSYNNLGVTLKEQGKFIESEACCRKSIECRPSYADAYNNLGLALDSQGRFEEAIESFEKALECNPNDALVLSNFSVTLITQGLLDKAEASLKRALEIAPTFINLYINLGITFLAQGRPQAAEEICLEALMIDPECLSAKGNLLFAMNYSANHTVDECFAQAREYNAMLCRKTKGLFTTWRTDSQAKRLRVGIVSADMRQHAVAYFLENVIRNINPDTIELIAYTADGREDEVTARLKPFFSVWKSLVGLDDQAAAQLIYNDGVQVLIDLSGHSAGNRLPVFAKKPAPIQVSWLGYFATTGLDAMDYFIADEVGVPAHNQNQFVEKIQYLPSTRLCFSVPNVQIAVSELPAKSNGYVTFGCFQNIAKVGDDVLSLWVQVMQAVPNARLRLQSKALGDAIVAKSVLDRIVNLGVDAERISVHGFDSREGYLAAHAEVDMILDTFPFNGGTTTCEALWMGVPTLTLAGSRLIARQGASLLSAAGLAGWVVETQEEFVAKGVQYASDIASLAKLRAGLREKVLASPLFDGRLFAESFEKALWQMSGLTMPKLLNKQKVNQSADEKKDKAAKTFNNEEIISDSQQSILVVSATRRSEQEFWRQSALGVSLKAHMARDARLSASVAFENTRGLSDVFNESIDQADMTTILIFIHDDVWIDEENFADAVISGLKSFDVIGVAGNKRRIANQPAWAFINDQFTWDDAVNLSGRVAHGQEAFGYVNDYGAVPAACELMDGVFLATKKSTLLNSKVKFDPQFDFHFYDLDFCRTARQAGLNLGTWLVNLTHQSGGAFGSAGWVRKYQLYLDKWERANAKDAELQQAMNDVLQLAIEHHQAGRLEPAMMLYEEILKIQANHAAANHYLGLIELQTKGVNEALTRLELAVQAAPESEQYWVSFIQALIQAGAIETAVNALELGQKFGLKPDTAQSLAAAFIQSIDAQ